MLNLHPMMDPARSKDFWLLILATNSNPNGDPQDDGKPRNLDDTDHGWVSGVSVKRKGRDFAQLFHEQLLAVPQGGIKSEIRGKSADMESYVATHWDARLFGGVPLKLKGDRTLGHAPITISAMNESLTPVEIYDFPITCAAGEKADEKDGEAGEGLRANMGEVSVVRHGLYLVQGTYTAARGIRNGVSPDDLRILFDSLFACWDHSQSAARPHVTLHAAFVATHSGVRRNENTTVARRRVQVSHPDEAHSIDDYTIKFDTEGSPQMDFHIFDDTTNGFNPAETV